MRTAQPAPITPVPASPMVLAITATNPQTILEPRCVASDRCSIAGSETIADPGRTELWTHDVYSIAALIVPIAT